MNEKKIEPTDAMVRDLEFRKKLVAMGPIGALRYVLNHPDAPGLFAAEWKANAEAAAERAERAEDRLADSVHVDEAARRVEAAREEGWDQATRWIDSYQGGPNGRTTSARSANPYRAVQELPTKCGTVIVANDGHKFIKAEVDGIAHRAREAVLGANGWWYGAWRKAEGDGLLSAMFPEHISAPTWKVDDQ